MIGFTFFVLLYPQGYFQSKAYFAYISVYQRFTYKSLVETAENLVSFQVERANYLLNAFVECAKNGETYEGRLISHLLHNPSEDGGQWDMLTNLVEKYGVVPKVCFPESWSAENSRKLGELLNNRVRFKEFVCRCVTRQGDWYFW
jgi:aminopeptidase C